MGWKCRVRSEKRGGWMNREGAKGAERGGERREPRMNTDEVA
jgi:hypothetical protein